MGGRHDSDADLSPRRSLDTPDVGERMTSGHRAGLVDGRSLKKDAAELRVKRLAALESAPDAATGRNAETVYRNKAGQKIGREEWVSEQQKKRKKRPSDYPEQELEWGGGLKQTANREEEQEELSRIAAQPFARFEPDEKYMEELKNKQDWNDPMRQSVAAEEKQAVSKPKCPFAPWPNRFNIAPGYRWDGKVRGNGYEHRWLDKKNHREFKKKEAYIYENLED
uniref:Pre-mRNA-splicing factor CWC26 n=1 Tax=Noctiluca scintillans TaxID=2966 RepID=A0A7S1AQE3_NOCSC|mmetsp:Transcript_54204/g.144832  ORF Transcript_54204/g.144832 Transcript_54204/m.144832 type:complete len:224 (+) Transcript_54204:1-672(+)